MSDRISPSNNIKPSHPIRPLLPLGKDRKSGPRQNDSRPKSPGKKPTDDATDDDRKPTIDEYI